jgi:hypothetical protein
MEAPSLRFFTESIPTAYVKNDCCNCRGEKEGKRITVFTNVKVIYSAWND